MKKFKNDTSPNNVVSQSSSSKSFWSISFWCIESVSDEYHENVLKGRNLKLPIFRKSSGIRRMSECKVYLGNLSYDTGERWVWLKFLKTKRKKLRVIFCQSSLTCHCHMLLFHVDVLHLMVLNISTVNLEFVHREIEFLGFDAVLFCCPRRINSNY